LLQLEGKMDKTHQEKRDLLDQHEAEMAKIKEEADA
jgi:hypothetical protein